MRSHEKVIFEYSHPGRGATDQWPRDPGPAATADIPAKLRRTQAPLLPEVGELETVRHFTRLSQLNFSIDTHFYPLGSCTMKYNPKACNQYAMLPEFLARHPLGPESHGQGFLACMYELQEMLKEVTGMQAVALSPMAGAHGATRGRVMREDRACTRVNTPARGYPDDRSPPVREARGGLRSNAERETGLEPATPSLEGSCSTN